MAKKISNKYQYATERDVLKLLKSKGLKMIPIFYRSIDSVSYIYGPPLVYQVMFSSLPICLMAYQVADVSICSKLLWVFFYFTSDLNHFFQSLDHGKFHVIFATLGFATCVQLWIPCYLGTLVRNKVSIDSYYSPSLPVLKYVI